MNYYNKIIDASIKRDISSNNLSFPTKIYLDFSGKYFVDFSIGFATIDKSTEVRSILLRHKQKLIEEINKMNRSKINGKVVDEFDMGKYDLFVVDVNNPCGRLKLRYKDTLHLYLSNKNHIIFLSKKQNKVKINSKKDRETRRLSLLKLKYKRKYCDVYDEENCRFEEDELREERAFKPASKIARNPLKLSASFIENNEELLSKSIQNYDSNNIRTVDKRRTQTISEKNVQKYNDNNSQLLIKSTVMSSSLSMSDLYNKYNSSDLSLRSESKKSITNSIWKLFGGGKISDVLVNNKVIYYFNPSNKEFIKQECRITFDEFSLLKSKYNFNVKIPVADIVSYNIYKKDDYREKLNTREAMNFYIEVKCVNEKSFLFGVRKEKNKQLFNKWFSIITDTHRSNIIDEENTLKINSFVLMNKKLCLLFVENLFDINFIMSNKKVREIVFEFLYDKISKNIVENYLIYKDLIGNKKYIQAMRYFKKIIDYFKEIVADSNPTEKRPFLPDKDTFNIFYSKIKEFEQDLDDAGGPKNSLLLDDLFFYFKNFFILPLFKRGKEKLLSVFIRNRHCDIRCKLEWLYVYYYLRHILINAKNQLKVVRLEYVEEKCLQIMVNGKLMKK